MRLVHSWLRELVQVPDDVEVVAREMSLRGFEVAEVEKGAQPVIDFEITANRPDCLNHLGLAREASVIWRHALHVPDFRIPDAGPGDALDVEIADAELCPRYCAQVFEVRPGESPPDMQQRLLAAGVRPINSIVDVTNYVMLELGQPMHAFDLERIGGRRIVIRRARAGERLRTLDGVERTLEAGMLVIADAERPMAVAGVMGGLDSEIDRGTRLMALESAYFQPASVRRTSKRLGLKTEASTRFERGADVNAPPSGIARAAVLFAQMGAGRPLGTTIDRYPSPRSPLDLRLRAARIERVLGQRVPESEIPRLLEPLGFAAARDDRGDGAGWRVTVPSFRVDVLREVDLIEEVGRHYAFDRVPATFPALTAPQAAPDPRISRDRLIRQALTAAGFSEAITFAFIERQAAEPFRDDGVELAAIANPLSEKFAVLRPSLLPGLVDACAHNRRRGRKDVRLFEAGSRFPGSGEERAVGIALCGSAVEPHWSMSSRTVDFFDVKGTVELLCSAFAVRDLEWVPAHRPWLVAGRAAEVRSGARSLGVVGQLRPEIAEARGFAASEAIYVGEIDTEPLGSAATRDDMRAESLPRFPSIVRDLSILVDEALPAGVVRGTIRSAAPATLASIVEFDRYQGKGVPEGRVSLSLRLTFRAPDRTLTDEEAQQAMDGIIAALRDTHRAEQR